MKGKWQKLFVILPAFQILSTKNYTPGNSSKIRMKNVAFLQKIIIFRIVPGSFSFIKIWLVSYTRLQENGCICASRNNNWR